MQFIYNMNDDTNESSNTKLINMRIDYLSKKKLTELNHAKESIKKNINIVHDQIDEYTKATNDIELQNQQLKLEVEQLKKEIMRNKKIKHDNELLKQQYELEIKQMERKN